MTVLHDTFTLERNYNHPPAKVFAAFSNPEKKYKWFANAEGMTVHERTLEFKVGGREVTAGRHANGMESRYVSTIHELVENQRIVNAYDLWLNGTLISVSLCTLELVANGKGTQLRYTEQGVYFDGSPEGPKLRKGGTEQMFDTIAKVL